ncbi:MAG TPA: HAD family hydrolase [Caldilineaceae bacterium]|nr:HAD family hydrolase [Caldilineaceae bacterium]
MGERRILAICLDSGDTLVDEGTEVKDERGVVLTGELIPGAAELVRTLHAQGYRLALVADGPAATFTNVLGAHGVYDLFCVHAISEWVGVEKPDPAIFRFALAGLDIGEEAAGRTIMVGNNLERDIAGANALGMISVWLDWAPRRRKVPATALETPRYIIKTPLELLSLLPKIEESLT